MTLKQYYINLKKVNPATQFRDTVLQECGVTYDTFYKWLNTETQPNRLTQQKIAELSGVDANKLFPVKQSQKSESKNGSKKAPSYSLK